MNKLKIIVTGSAGFIGYHLTKRLVDEKYQVIGIDNLNNYYNPLMKQNRLKNITGTNFTFMKADISKKKTFENLGSADIIIHLAAQAGVRYSIENPYIYETSNNLGSLNVFEYAQKKGINHIIFGSSSSVYGNNKKIPFSENDNVDFPISLYAATKKYNELLAHAYHNLYNINMTVLRFFTVYGAYGRPDMAYFKFAKNILLDKPINIFNNGNLQRDFTYISDVIDGIVACIQKPFKYEIFNLGNSNPVKLLDFINILEKYLGKKAIKNFVEMQKGDVLRTYADITKSKKLLNYNPKISIDEGLKRFCKWFLENDDWVLKI